MINDIISYLEELYPNAFCELNYNHDYELLIAIMLSAQTTDKKVNNVTKVLFDKYNSLSLLSEAPIEDIASIIHEIGTYNKKSEYVHLISKRLVSDNISIIPNDREYLESLPGVGRKTANVFLSIIYNEPTMAVDTHVARVSKRLGLVKENDSVFDIEKKLMKIIPHDRLGKIHHQMVFFGRYKCKAMKPECGNCKLKKICKKNKG